ncbi:hypothetical protein CLIM01_13098 [Colletotrichum limetticola]|uniref:Uncharacterized protein n=1 Tax=Colletotrichum limetticola TaxID=1209924 RepID=A0ABQ9PHV9_9PEZI|nr:hypothetical protein CLIM01_13098 [Colletotrichum limetticola]
MFLPVPRVLSGVHCVGSPLSWG